LHHADAAAYPWRGDWLRILGDTRAVMIEGPSHEALELVEIK
jgi:hypothetical protein